MEVLEDLACQDIDRILPRAKLRCRDLAESFAKNSLLAMLHPTKTNSANTGNPSAGRDSLATRRRSRGFVPGRQHRALKAGPGRWRPHLRRAPLCQGIDELPSAN